MSEEKLKTFVKYAQELMQLPEEVRELVLEQATDNGDFELESKEKEKRKHQISQAVDYLERGDD